MFYTSIDAQKISKNFGDNNKYGTFCLINGEKGGSMAKIRYYKGSRIATSMKFNHHT